MSNFSYQKKIISRNDISRHPVIDLPGLVKAIDGRLYGLGHYGEWRLGAAKEIAWQLHLIPLVIALTE